jgi:enamine deaminase RidA (YjgF/YER057c/UK114 family)
MAIMRLSILPTIRRSVAFRNIDLALKAAGGRGISHVYKIVSYHVNLGKDDMPFTKKNLIKWFPDHKPI